MSSQKVSKYSTNDLKNASDDALAPYLTSLSKPYTFVQQHRHVNVRLAVGYTAVVIAGVLFYADWKLGWDATKPYTLPACVAYFVLNGFLTYWIWAVQAGTVFVGVREGGQRIVLKSSAKKHTPDYTLKVRYEPASQSTVWEDKEIQGRFTEWFNEHGFLQQKALRSWLARNVEVVGLADPGSRQSAEKRYDGVVDEVMLASLNYGATTGSDAVEGSPAAKGKKGKRKA